MSIHSTKFLHFFFLAIILLGVFSILGGISAPIEAASSDNLSGYAWSEAIGWISFNCANSESCSPNNYGVHIAPSGALSGYAWAETIGWISFNASDTSGCPLSPCAATFNKTTGALTGWARALAQDTGFDGWIRLSGQSYATGVYDISGDGNGCEWGGFAWGSDVIGWISFSGASYGVVGSGDACTETPIAPPSTPSGGSTQLEVSCTPSRESAVIGQPVTWTATAEGGTGTYIYDWQGSVPLDLEPSVAVVTVSYTTAGTKTGRVAVNSGLQDVVVDCTDPVVVGEGGSLFPPLSVSCSATPESADMDEEVVWEADVSGGTGDYAYLWGGDIPLDERTTNPVSLSYGTSGTKDGSVTVSSGTQAESVSCENEVAIAGSGIVLPSGRPAAELFILGAPRTVLSGATTKIYWDTNNVRRRSCRISSPNEGGAWGGESGLLTTGPITETSVYTLSCRDLDNNIVTDQEVITLKPSFQEF